MQRENTMTHCSPSWKNRRDYLKHEKQENLKYKGNVRVTYVSQQISHMNPAIKEPSEQHIQSKERGPK